MSATDGALPKGGGVRKFPSLCQVTSIFHMSSDLGRDGTQSWAGRYIDLINSSDLLNPSNDSDQGLMSRTAGKIVRFFGRVIAHLATPVVAVLGAAKHGACFLGHTVCALADFVGGNDEGEFSKATASLLSCAKDVAHVFMAVKFPALTILAYALFLEDQKDALRRSLRNTTDV